MCHWCDMMYDVMLCRMMWWCYAVQDDICAEDTHIPTMEYTISLSFIFRLHHLFFGVSALTFRCKPPLGASPSISAVLRWLFALRLIFQRYQRWLFAVSSAFPWERLLSRKLTLRSLRNGFFVASSSCSASPYGRLSSFSLFFPFCLHSMVHAQFLHLYFWGILLS